MNRTETLDAARACITVDRAATYGDAERNFGTIAAMWSAYAEHPFTAADVAVMMTLMKCARIKSNPGHQDSYTDAVGYLALGAEIATAEEAGAIKRVPADYFSQIVREAGQ